MESLRDESRFQTTSWSLVIRAGADDTFLKQGALADLCRLYWKPLFVFCLGSGRQPQDAEDLTQAFFAHLLSRDSLRVADPERGRFRSFLLTSFKHFIAGEWDKSQAVKRGGGIPHISFDATADGSGLPIASQDLSPEEAYDLQWAHDVVGRATDLLCAEVVLSGKDRWFDLIAGPEAGAPYQEVAVELSTTLDAVKSFAKRTRQRFRALLEREIADTVSSPREAALEIAWLAELLRR